MSTIKNTSLALLAAAAAVLSPALVGAEESAAALPLTSLALFTSGVGYFQHDGSVTGDARLELTFPSRGINDIIKSLILRDLDGGTVSSVTYASRDPITRALKTFAVDLTGNPELAAILQQVRGQQVELSVQEFNPYRAPYVQAGSQTAKVEVPPVTKVSGTVVGVESRGHPVTGETAMLNLLTAQGMKSISIYDIQEVRFQAPGTRADIEKALALLAAAKDLDKKTVAVHFAGAGKRRVRVGYLQETPVWKTSYRLSLGDAKEHLLQGWAVVENTTDADWNNVGLTLVSGRPITFAMDLYTPLYVTRPEAQLELYQSLRPQTYDMAMDETAPEEDQYAEEAEAIPMAKSAMADMAKRSELAAAPRGAAQPATAPRDDFSLTQGVAAAAKGAAVGTLFQYVIAKPVTLARQQSALLPILNQNVGGERYAIYNESVDPARPLSALKLKNTSSLHLQQGPITVFDGGAYAGDAQIADLPAGSEVFISYAVDLETEVEAVTGTGTEDISTVKITRGTVITTWRQQRERVYNVKNRGQRAKTVIIEHPVSAGFNLVEPKQPMETARGLYRFSLPVDKGKTAKLSVVEDRMVDQSVAFTNIPSDRIELYLRTKNVSQAVKDALQKLVALKGRLADATAARARIEEEIRAIYTDQDRIRSNMGKLSRDSDLYKKYEKTLSEQENRLFKLDADLDKAKTEEATRKKEVDAYVQSVDVK
ncbi:MAG: hypothetical protein A2177_04465 [Spirochaetes bacterium RBG_13_68_11]|nr:MAG: hypothetical protein A2177_04465 [Spirochaetes bacterium RBG_13_68_11]